MEQCWNANPLKRPDINVLLNDIREIKRSYYENKIDQKSEDSVNDLIDVNSTLNTKNIGSKLYTFKDIPIPKNIIEDNDEIFNNPNLHSEDQDELEIPDDIEDILGIPIDVKNDNNNDEPKQIPDEDSVSNDSKKKRNCSSINVLKDIITRLTKKKPKKSKLKITYY
ncbi:uncharacterized protein OCT59_020024 [Rhizophagus irregularis]|uniref:uncharacterized protein n=1 Tax=Rhizophagus irregularis TaxID=588596 RepID=UPI00332862D6|nr:hypothetical protein OCT59_020024 [Rhizophagus irregularis]